MQPLVVKLIEKNEQKNSVTYELIDGQQRLTTFYLILCALSDSSFDDVFSLTTQRTLKYRPIEDENKDVKVLQSELDESIDFFGALKELVDCKNYKRNGISQLAYNSFFKKLQDNEAYENIDIFLSK